MTAPFIHHILSTIQGTSTLNTSHAAGPRHLAEFGEYRLDLDSGDLWRHRSRLRLQDQPFRILKLLLERPGELVTREQLHRSLWSEDTFVDFENGLNAAINRLRDTLHDTARRPRFIETIPRRGYRFIGDLRFPQSPSPSLEAQSQSTPQPVAYLRPVDGPARRKLLTVIVLALVSGLVLAGWQIFAMSHSRTVSIHSLAVLPLQNLTGDPKQDYFAAGLTDELTTDLAQISSLRVVSGTSATQFKGNNFPLSQIAHRLNVDAIVEGSVSRDGSRIRITAQLISARTDTHLWAASYEREGTEILVLEDDVARAVAAQVRARLTSEEKSVLTTSSLVNPRAYEAYLQSRFLIENQRNARGAAQSVRYAKLAISLDPNFALGYAQMTQAYGSLWTLGGGTAVDLMPKAKAAAEKAVDLDPGLAAAHTALGSVLLIYEYDWPRAETELRKGVALEPNDADAHRWYGNCLLARGHLDDALAEMRRAQELDPLSMWTTRDVGRVLYFARRYDEAIAMLQRAHAISPEHLVIDNWIGWSYLQKGMEKEALAALIEHASAEGITPADLGAIREAAAKDGLRGYVRAMLKLQERSPSNIDAYSTAQLYAEVGDRENALAWLGQALQQHSFWLTWIAPDPAMDPLRGDPRFQDLLRRMKLR